ncbi:hypothetical protein B0H16DRAFT_1538918 [Mycena metata]|uniref:polynucleotide adenylyltransferase n=1 Tax=Mycena metata TaxID=1033252 RepID=A0AAD7J3F1_9AGAR|nr:hypothetical protein B0H16DRAFT_1538918 [Mycena metata]
MAYSLPSDGSDVGAHRRLPSRHRFFADLSQCLFDFVIELLPTSEEMAVKENVRKLLERLIRTIEPDSRLLSFGSTANGFSLRNSDMDLCCLIDSEERLSATDLVTMLGDLLERETKFHVKPLPHARIPIVKLSLDPSPGLPLGIACDIGFENRLALENTRLLMCYAMIDPTRVRTMVLFLKVWSKRRKINSPYKGTLSSYGYVLLVIYFLVHVKNPPVLPNLQQMPPLRPITKEDTHLAGYNTWFFDDIELLRTRWHSENNESVAELLIDFYRYYARDFSYNTGVASIRAGLLKKSSKGWQNDLTSRYHDSRERNRLCIEDPFELDFNVGRCVTKDGIYTIRGEFMRASRILSNRPERAVVALAELCLERPDEDLVSAPTSSFNVLRPPPQTPYSVGSGSRSKAPSAPTLTAPVSVTPSAPMPTTLPALPPSAHMAPKRSKWTSPPPPGAPEDARALFESNLGHGLELATSSTEAREREQRARQSASSEGYSESASEGTSEVFTDTDASVSDAGSDVVSVRSFTEGVAVREGDQIVGHGNGWRRPSWHSHNTMRPPMQPQQHLGVDAAYYGTSGRLSAGARGRNQRERERTAAAGSAPPTAWDAAAASSSRRSSSGPPRTVGWGPVTNNNTPTGTLPPLPPSPEEPPFNSHSHSPSGQHFSHFDSQHTVFYQTSPRPSPHSSPRPNVYPASGSSSASSSQYSVRSSTSPYPVGATTSSLPYSSGGGNSSPSRAPQYPQFLTNSNIIGLGVPTDVFSSNHPPLSLALASQSSSTPREHTPVPKAHQHPHPHSSSNHPSTIISTSNQTQYSNPPPNPPSPSWTRIVSQHTQASHSRSSSTNAPTPKPHMQSVFSQQQQLAAAHAHGLTGPPLLLPADPPSPPPSHPPSASVVASSSSTSRLNSKSHHASNSNPRSGAYGRHLQPLRPADDGDDEAGDQNTEFSSAPSSPTPSLSTGYETSVSTSPSPSPPLAPGNRKPAVCADETLRAPSSGMPITS